jgi:hypothetical protein
LLLGFTSMCAWLRCPVRQVREERAGENGDYGGAALKDKPRKHEGLTEITKKTFSSS